MGAHFFCESCGTEVPRSAGNCPKCGRRFASVLCPACGFSGGESLFKEGCPACGYSSKASITEKSSRPQGAGVQKKAAPSLPFWLYFLTAAVFTAILAALLFAVF